MQYVQFRLHTNYFLLLWNIPEEITRRSMLFNKSTTYHIKHIVCLITQSRLVHRLSVFYTSLCGVADDMLHLSQWEWIDRKFEMFWILWYLHELMFFLSTVQWVKHNNGNDAKDLFKVLSRHTHRFCSFFIIWKKSGKLTYPHTDSWKSWEEINIFDIRTALSPKDSTCNNHAWLPNLETL